MMKLLRLDLTNFRQYYGAQNLRFSREPERNVTIVNGVNGAGKTSLFMALNWCLYGRAALDDVNVGELVNKRALSEASTNSSVEAQVALSFLNKGVTNRAQRTITYSKTGRATWSVDYEDFKLYQMRQSGVPAELQNPTGKIEGILPAAVRTYFFFDGEKIDRFAAPDHEDEVRDAVRNVLRIEVLERSKNHLDTVAKELQRSMKGQVSDQLQTLQDEEANVRAKKEAAEQRLIEVNKEIKEAKRQIDVLDRRLGEVTIVKQLVERRRAVQDHYSSSDRERVSVEAAIRDAATQGYIALAAPLCRDAVAALDDVRQRGQIPSGIREQFLKDLLSEMQCVCGRGLAPGTEPYEKISALLARAVPAQLEDLLLQTGADLQALVRKAESQPGYLAELVSKRHALENELEQLYDQIDELTRAIGKSGDEDAAALEKKLQKWQEKHQDLLLEMDRLERSAEGYEATLRDLNNKIKQLEAQEATVERIKRKYSLARAASDAVDQILASFAADMRDSIQREAQTVFRRLVWKQSQFEDVRLSDDYRLEVLDRWGLPARLELSAGERQVLSLAFIAGMARVSGEEAPLVMDTPFGRLSAAHRENIAANLPGLAAQVVLLVQDQELLGKARKVLEPKIGAEYQLTFDETTGCTTIEAVLPGGDL